MAEEITDGALNGAGTSQEDRTPDNNPTMPPAPENNDNCADGIPREQLEQVQVETPQTEQTQSETPEPPANDTQQDSIGKPNETPIDLLASDIADSPSAPYVAEKTDIDTVVPQNVITGSFGDKRVLAVFSSYIFY